jgi:hypothetical protein
LIQWALSTITAHMILFLIYIVILFNAVPMIQSFFSNPMFRPMAEISAWTFIVSILQTALLVILYDVMGERIPGSILRKGTIFGLLMWTVTGLVPSIQNLVTFRISTLSIVVFTLMGFFGIMIKSYCVAYFDEVIK